MPHRIEIYCDDSSHEDRRWFVNAFAAPGFTAPYKWRVGAARPHAFKGIRIAEQRLPGRTRYKLPCDLCGRSVVVRAERMHPVLDKLAEGGVSEISLTGLAAIL